MPSFLQQFFAKILIALGLVTQTTQPSTIPEVASAPTEQVAVPAPEEVKPEKIIVEKTIVKDLSAGKVKEYEAKIAGLQNQITQLQNRLAGTYREIRESGDPNGMIVRFYPHDGDAPERLDTLLILSGNRSTMSNLEVKVAKQEHTTTGYLTLSTQNYTTDSKGWVRNLGIRLEKDSAGKSKYYYKFYVTDTEEKFLFVFPSDY